MLQLVQDLERMLLKKCQKELGRKNGKKKRTQEQKQASQQERGTIQAT